MKLYFFIGIILLITAAGCDFEKSKNSNAAELAEKDEHLEAKKQQWIFLMAGQSNMAGRGVVEPQDTITNGRIFTLNKDYKWVLAKEPLHFYEPSAAGLDCGLSFGRHLIENLNDKITIGLVPCAVGGSSIEQWLGDSLFREVKLLSNLKTRIDSSRKNGTIKALLWHQGENDAYLKLTPGYKDKLRKLFTEIRSYAGNDSLPILIGKLGSFTKPPERQERWDSLNNQIEDLASADNNIHVIETKDLVHNGDYIHFNSESLRIMGKRFADEYLRHLTIESPNN